MRTGWRSITMGSVCLVMAGCGTPQVSTLDPAIRNYANGAKVAYERGMPEQAAELYGKALNRAKLIDLPEEAGRNAYNLALCRIAMGQPAEAQKLLRQARMLLSNSGPEAARAYVAEAEAARMQGETSNVVMLVTAALDRGTKSDDIAQAELLLAEIDAGKGDFASAKAHYQRVVHFMTGSATPMVRARIDGLAACLVQAAAIKGDAAGFLERRASWFKVAGQYRQMAESLKQAGTAFAETDRPARAFECWMRAAQSLDATGARAMAREAAEQAVDLARKLGDPAYAERAAILIEGIGP